MAGYIFHDRRLFYLVIGTLFVFVLIARNHHQTAYRYISRNVLNRSIKHEYTDQHQINTSRGVVSYEEIERNIYIPLGYRIKAATIPIPTLEFIDEPTCNKVFSDWNAIAKTYDPQSTPPKNMPEELVMEYTMQGYSNKIMWYINEKSTAKAVTWNGIPKMLKSDPHSYVKYGKDGMAVFHATKYFGLKEQTGLVIGSLKPWAEAFALTNGAKKVTTVEYQKISVVGTDQVDYLHPFTFSEKMTDYVDIYDFAISFSSIEHSGLGRYGDPMDPIGDIREVLKTKCLLKSGGLFFLGLPRGQDGVSFNVHRIYGRIRLGILFAGFTHVATFRGDQPNPITLTSSDFDGHDLTGRASNQEVWVLKKL